MAASITIRTAGNAFGEIFPVLGQHRVFGRDSALRRLA